MNPSRTIQALIDQKKIDATAWARIEKEAAKSGRNPEELIVEQGIIKENDLAKIKADLFTLPFVDLVGKEVSHDILTIIPQAVAENHQLVAFEKKGKDVKIALVDPGNYRAIESIDFWANKEGYRVSFFVTTPTSFASAAKNYTAFQKEVSEALEVIEERKATEEVIDETTKPRSLFENIKKAPVAKIVSSMIKEAVDAGASDIHIEPGEKESRIRFRVDGQLRTYLNLPSHLHASIISRIKVLSRLKIDETRLPQDGRIRADAGNKKVDLRISTMPVLDSEKVAMRILPTSSQIMGLEDLGFRGPSLDAIHKIQARPVGVLLISGPTGSGKTTTLYSILNSLNKESTNIITLEDPVEYFLPGVNQVQVNPDIGLTFASGLRAVLRQDPNIAMVGEIRDTETAELAIHAALTGHFMLSTIHAKDVLGVIPRLSDMHVEPFLISSALNTILAQRLVRKICVDCKGPMETPKDLEKEIRTELDLIPAAAMPANIDKKKPLTFFKGKGCATCNDSGYKGRIVVTEVIMMTDELRNIVSTTMSNDAMKKEMVRQGMITIKQDAILKALDGITSLEEILRVTRE